MVRLMKKESQNVLCVKWTVSEKVKDIIRICKDFPTYPRKTGCKSLSLATSNRWICNTFGIKAVYLQSNKIN